MLSAAAFGQAIGEPVSRDGSGRLELAAEQAAVGLGSGPFPEWWGGAGHPEPRMWGGWEHENETWMHVLDVPTAEYPNLRFGFFQQLTVDGLRYRTAWVYVAQHPPDFLVHGAYRMWTVRVDTNYEWRYLGYWRPGDGWDAVVCERVLPGVVEFCTGDPDGKVWVVIVFDRPAMFMGYWSEYPSCPPTCTYGIGIGEWGGMLGPITRWPTPYQWPPCYVQWTAGGHRVW